MEYMIFPDKVTADKCIVCLKEHHNGDAYKEIRPTKIDGTRYAIQRDLEITILNWTSITRDDYVIEELDQAFFTALWDIDLIR